MPSLLDYDFASPLPHPGETLREHLMIALGLTAETLAGHLGLADPGRIRRIADELEPMTPDLALRLERVFGMDAQTWMALQAQHDLSRETIALRHQLVGLARIETDLAAAIPSERFVAEHIDTPAEIGRARQEIADGARPRKDRFKL